MRRLIGALLVFLLTGACGTSPGLSTASTDGETTIPSSTDATTVSVPPTTTSTTIVPSTTTTLLDGNWAVLPVITASRWEGVLGWWDGSRWVQAEDGMDLPVEGGEDYQIAVLGSEDVTTIGGPRITACDINAPDIDLPGVELAEPGLLETFIESSPRRSISGVAISAPWNIHPRPATPGEAHPDLEVIALGLLAERGFVTDRVDIVQTVDADLDDDGAIETLVVVEDTELANSQSGVYSLLFAVSPSFGGPAVVAESVIPSDEDGFPASFRVSAVADLSGDGTMEVVVNGSTWESNWATVFELVDSGFIERLGAGCGV